MSRPSDSQSIVPVQGDEFDAASVRKILLLGSGATKIGEGAECDHAATEASMAFRRAGRTVILVDPNISAHHTSHECADGIYFVPVTPDFVGRIIELERPDAIAITFGGQAALSCALQLREAGVFDTFNVRVLGTPLDGIHKTEDRAVFNATLRALNIDVPRSFACTSIDEGLKAAEAIAYPVIVRSSFASGGRGSGRATQDSELKELLQRAFGESSLALVEEDLTGWKEIECEVLRDSADQCVLAGILESVDPLGVHTGESIVVTPVQTLSPAHVITLRETAFSIARHLGIIGTCGIQFALDPRSGSVRAIDANAHFSRSASLASKVASYPLASFAARVSLGEKLSSVDVPVIDCVAVKIPRWNLEKFGNASSDITSEMKSVGEALGLGSSFEEALQKAINALNMGIDGLYPCPFRFESLTKDVRQPSPRRIFAIAEALKQAWTIEEASIATGIDAFYIRAIAHCSEIADVLRKRKADPLDAETLRNAKRAGFSDKSIGDILDMPEDWVRQMRAQCGMSPKLVSLDTSHEPNRRPAYFLTYGDAPDIAPPARKSKTALLLGGGPHAVGSSVEFDWCCAQASATLRGEGFSVAIINANPQSVSTDPSAADMLFFEPLSEERIRDIADILDPTVVVSAMGGQGADIVALKLARSGLAVAGTDALHMHRCQDRTAFTGLLDELGIAHPAWKELTDSASAATFAAVVQYPVLIRPVSLLSSAVRTVVHSEEQLMGYFEQKRSARDETFIVSKFLDDAKEIEIDGVAQKGKLLLYAIAEHIEHGGIHSGNSTVVMPPQRVTLETLRKVKRAAKRLVAALDVSGPFNIQFLAKGGHLYVIECALRASRTLPFSSKVTGVNFAALATRSLLQTAPEDCAFQTLDLDHVCVKAPQFCFSSLPGADPKPGVEMASTGEAACFGENAEQALLLALLATGFSFPRKNILLSIGRLEDKVALLPAVQMLHEKGLALYATQNTHEFLKVRSIPTIHLHMPSEPRSPNVREYLDLRRIDLVINIPTHAGDKRTDGFEMRRLAVDRGIPLITNVQLAARFVEAFSSEDSAKLPLMRWPELLGA